MNNQVIAGDYKNWDVVFSFNKIYLMHKMQKIQIKKNSISSWELINDIEKNTLWSQVIASGVGGIIFGTVGAIAGGAIASKKSNTIYLISIEFLSGKKSLLQLDSKAYLEFVKYLY